MKNIDRDRAPALLPCIAALATPLLAPSAAGQEIRRVNGFDDGTQPLSQSVRPSISDDGERLVLSQTGNNDGFFKVWLYDWAADSLQLLAAINGSLQNPRLSGSGDWVVYQQNSQGMGIVLKEVDTGLEFPASTDWQGQVVPFDCYEPDVSGDGDWVVWHSGQSQIAGVPDTNNRTDVFLFDRASGLTRPLSLRWDGAATGNMDSAYSAVAAGGRSIAFSSTSSDLLPPGADANGNVQDVFVFERDPDGNGVLDEGNERVVLVSVHSDGTPANQPCYSPDISGDGRFVTFDSNATTLVDGAIPGVVQVYVHDRDPDGNGVYDEGNGVTTCASVSSTGELGKGESREPHVSTDGSSVVFRSLAPNLTLRDGGPFWQVYRHDRTTGQTVMVSTDVTGEPGSQSSGIHGGYQQMTVSGDGRRVGFISYADDLVPADPRSGQPDVFIMQPCLDPALDLGYGIAGSNGRVPELSACRPQPGDPVTLRLRDLPPGARCALLRSGFAAYRPFHGSVLVPGSPRAGWAIGGSGVLWFNADAAGDFSTTQAGNWPLPLYVQVVALDPAAAAGVALSNALELVQ